VARREQLREAAVVLSCVPRGERVPLVILDPPPCTQAEYGALYAAYRDLADARDRAFGTELARGAPREGPVPPALGDVDAAAEALTPYREWAKHQDFVARLLQEIGPARAVFLFSPGAEEACYIDPLAVHRLDTEQHPLIAESTATLSLQHGTLAELATSAWHQFRGTFLDPNAALEIPESETAAFLTGLYRAFQRDVALLPLPTAAPADLGPCDPAAGTSSEAVMIECTDDAERLLGVQYARMRDARLVVTGEPDGAPIESARAAVERRNAPSPLPAGLTKEQIVAAVRALLADDASSVLHALEIAVSAALPDAAFEAVGALPLTVLTTSTPYHFVVKHGVTWAEKPIGHVAGDISLLLLTEMFGTTGDTLVGFNALFDPGYITTTETRDVLGDLRDGGSFSLLLAGAAGAATALVHLATTLPIELLFFNTHGSENGIKLADMPVPLPAYKLVQRTALSSRPIVFNNSCLSWVGVGREFVRAGARGYIGTLWSVHDADAATYAKCVIGRLVTSEQSVAAAMRDTGESTVDTRAYIFVGTAAVRLIRRPPARAAEAPARRLRAASYLLHSLESLIVQAAGSLANPTISALVDRLLTDAEAQLAALDEAPAEPSSERIDAAIRQMNVYAALVERNKNETSRAQAFFTRWAATIAKISDRRLGRSSMASLLFYAARVPARVGPWQEAVGALTGSIAAARDAGDVPVRQYLELCDAYLSGGAAAAAREALESAQQAYANASAGADAALLGRQANVALAYGSFAVAVERAALGAARAIASDDLRGCAAAKIDETSAHFGLDDPQSALRSAQTADAYARLAYDDELGLRANAALATALLRNDRAAEAEAVAQRGLTLARARGWTLEIAAHAEILGDVAMQAENAVGAVVNWCAAAWLYVDVPRPVCEARLLEKTKRAALGLGAQGVIIQYLRLSLGVVDDFGEPLRAAVARQFVTNLTELVARIGKDGLRSDLEYLRLEAQSILTARGSSASTELNFMVAMSSGAADDAA